MPFGAEAPWKEDRGQAYCLGWLDVTIELIANHEGQGMVFGERHHPLEQSGFLAGLNHPINKAGQAVMPEGGQRLPTAPFCQNEDHATR